MSSFILKFIEHVYYSRFIKEQMLNFENSINFLNALDRYNLNLEKVFWAYIAPSLRAGPPTCVTFATCQVSRKVGKPGIPEKSIN